MSFPFFVSVVLFFMCKSGKQMTNSHVSLVLKQGSQEAGEGNSREVSYGYRLKTSE